MVAALRDERTAGLICEPHTDPGAPDHLLGNGGRLRRTAERDRIGAMIQHAILAYVVGGESRASISERVGYSQRQVQAWIGGEAWLAYTQPVLERLRSLGIGRLRGDRCLTGARFGEIVSAQADVLARVAWTFRNDPRPEAQRLVEDARLLSAGLERLP
jgi:hypothetical protein